MTSMTYLKILPGKKINTLESLGEGVLLTLSLCDGDNVKIAALSKDYPITGLDKANVTSDATNIYAADDSHTVGDNNPSSSRDVQRSVCRLYERTCTSSYNERLTCMYNLGHLGLYKNIPKKNIQSDSLITA